MTNPNALLDVLDAADAVGGPRRALLLAELHPASAGTDDEPLGRTTARLLRVLGALAGPELVAIAPCPTCAATVEIAVQLSAVLELETEIVDHPAPIQIDDREVNWRPASYSDLVAIAESTADAAAQLLARCTGEARIDERTRAVLVEAMTVADPLAELDVDVSCPECSDRFRADLDCAEFLWAEVNGRARTLLAEVDILARAYSWSEVDILSLSASRRARYVAVVTGES